MHLIYGAIIDDIFYSNNTVVPIRMPNGFYCFDIGSDDYLKTIKPCNLIEFDRYVKKSNKMKYINGLSFKESFIPLNLSDLKGRKFPIKIYCSFADEWEIIKVLYFARHDIFLYIESLVNDLQIKLSELQTCFETGNDINSISGITPTMRILFTFHSIEKARIEQELKKQREEQLKKTVRYRLKSVIENAGGRLLNFVKRIGRGFEVTWEADNEKINTLIDPNFKVIEAGFCMSGYDKTQSIGSAVNVLKSYKKDGSYIHKTRET